MIQMGKSGNDIGKFIRSTASGTLQIGKHSGGAYGTAGTTTTEIYVDANSNVGIGNNTTIGAGLHVKGADDLNATTGLLVENNSGTDLFFLRNGGAFGLGSSATNTSETNVCIGIEAATPSVYGVAIGRKTSIGGTASYATVIGNQSSTNGAQSVVVGAYSLVGFKGATLGYGAGSASNYAVNIGNAANGSGVSSITLNANSGSATPSTVNAFGVYMSSNTTPDFRIAHDGDSYITGSGKFGIGRSNITATLDVTHYDATRKLANFSDNSQTEVFSIANNGTVKITGQAYTELHDTTNTTLTVDWDNSNIQELTSLTGSLTFTASNPKAGATYILTLAQTGTVTATWTGVKWPAATAPTLSGAGKTDVVTLICYDAAANSGAGAYYGSSVLNFTT